MDKPYADSGGENSKRVDPDGGYDMVPPLLSATKVYPNDAINDPGTTNTHWTAEIALPISKLMENGQTSELTENGQMLLMTSREAENGQTSKSTD